MQRTREEASSGLLPEEREAAILQQMRTHGRVLAADLAQALDVSEHTVRRHLRDLAEAGHCKRVYGGAILLSPASGSAVSREARGAARKTGLAALAATLVRPGQVILLDAGTTNTAIAAALPEDAGLVVVTNSPAACVALAKRRGVDVVLIGGQVRASGGGSTGATALLQVQQIKADLCFLGACAFDPQDGVGAFDAEEAELKRAMVRASGHVAIALTSEKLMTAAAFTVAPASAIETLVVEDIALETLATLRAVCANVLVARA